MATSNRRVAAYLPSEIDEAFKAYKIKNGFSTEDDPTSNDSKALIEIVRQFLDIEYQVAHSVSLPDNLVTQDQLAELRNEFESKVSELLKRIESSSLTQGKSERVAVSNVSNDEMLSVSDLAKRLGMARTTLGHWKNLRNGKCKTVEEVVEATREKDPQGIGWMWDEKVNKFRPEKPLSDEYPTVSQGKLLH